MSSASATPTTPSTSKQQQQQQLQHETPTLNSLLQKPVASISNSQANQNPYSAPTPPFGASGPPQTSDLVSPASLAFDPRWAAAAAAAAATTGRYPANMPPNDNAKNVTTAETIANQIKMHQAGMMPNFMAAGAGQVPPYQTLPLRPTHGQFVAGAPGGGPVYMTAGLPQQYNPHSFMSPLNIPTLPSTTAGTPPARFGYQQQPSDVPTSNGLETKPKSANSSFPNSPATHPNIVNTGQKEQQGPKQHPAVAALKQESNAEKSPGVELLQQQSSSRSPSTAPQVAETTRSSPATSVQQMRHSPVSPATAPAFAPGLSNPQHQFPPNMNLQQQQQPPFNPAAAQYQTQYPGASVFNGPSSSSGGAGRFRGPTYNMEAYRQMAYGAGNQQQQLQAGNMIYGMPPGTKMAFVRNGMIPPQNFQMYGAPEDSKQGLNGRNTPSVNTNSSDSRLSSTPLAGDSKASIAKFVNNAKDSHPSTPAMLNSPGGGAGGDATDEAESSLSSPSWHGTPMSPANSTRHSSSSHTSNRPGHGMLMSNHQGPPMNMSGGQCPPNVNLQQQQQQPLNRQNLIDRLVGDVQGGHFAEWDERRRFMDHYVAFCEMQGLQNPLYQQLASGHPTVSKQPVDLFILYKFVKSNGGYVQCSKKRAWREMCKVFNVNESNSASGQIKKQYAKFVLPYECFYDLNKSDPEPLIRMCESKKKPKKEKPQLQQQPGTPNFGQEPGSYQQGTTPVSYPGGLQTQPHFFATPSPRPPATMASENDIGIATPKRPSSQAKSSKGSKKRQSISSVTSSTSNDATTTTTRLPPQQQQMSIESAVNPFDDSIVKPNVAAATPLRQTPAPGTQFHQVCRPPLPFGDPNLIEQQQKMNTKQPGTQQQQPFPLQSQPQQVQNADYVAAAANHHPPTAPGSSNQPPMAQPAFYNGSAAPAAHYPPSADNNASGFLKPQQPPPQQQQPWAPYGTAPPPPQPHYYGQNAAGSAVHLPPAAGHRTQIPPTGMSNTYPYNSMNVSSARTVIDPSSLKVRNNQVQGPSRYGMVAPYGSNLRKESPLNPGCVEATGVKVSKRKKILAKDIQKVDLWRLIMALKSGLYFETSWALNVLTVLLYDDSTLNFFDLSNMPGFVSVLVETLKHYLDQFAEIIVPSSSMSAKATTPPPMPRPIDDDYATTPCVTILKRPKNCTISVKDDVREERAASPLRPEDDQNDPCDELCLFMQGISERKRPKVTTHVEQDDQCPVISKKSKLYWENDRLDERTIRQTTWRIFSADEDRRRKTSRRPLDVCSTVLGVLRALVQVPENENLVVNKNVGACVQLIKILTQILKLGADCLDADQTPVPPDQRPKKWPPIDNGEENSTENAVSAQDAPIRLDDPLFFYDDLLRLCDDALVILCHLASCLDFYDYPALMVERLLSLLVRWTLLKTAGQSDLVGGVFSLPVLLSTNQNEGGIVGQSFFSTPPNRCSLEILCKLTVFERNVDLLLATPPRRNIERFMRKLSEYLAPGPSLILGVPHNDPILREMALVIVAAMCQASPEACRFFALETAMVERLASFLEQANSDMLRVAQTHSLQTLRDNPEIIGTSVGMLRRAAKALLCAAKSDLTAECKSRFKPHLSKFITITMSQLMDSRVGHTVAEILFELQQESTAS